MRLDRLLVLGLFLVGCALAYWIGLGSTLGISFIIVALFMLLFGVLGHRLATEEDPWLSRLVQVAYGAKIVATIARWGMAQFLYGTGDSFGYHEAGLRFAGAWRELTIPVIEGRSMGTRFVENVTALLYAPYEPHIFGGFTLFSALSFIGQIMFYLAFRRWYGGRPLRRYALFVFFVPTLAFWPSSIGKDALMVLFLGLAAYGASRLLESYRIRWILLFALGMWGAAVIRSHVALIVGVAVIGASVICKTPQRSAAASLRKLVFLVIAAAGAAFIFTLFAEAFDIGGDGDGPFAVEVTVDDLDPLVADIERRTGQGGSAIEDSGAVESIADVPAGFARVMFSPYPWQATAAQTAFAAAEALVFLGLFVWALPGIWWLIRHPRRHAYVVFSGLFTLGFGIAFTAVLNVGILTRQRGQVIAFFLALCIGARAEYDAAKSPANSQAVTPPTPVAMRP